MRDDLAGVLVAEVAEWTMVRSSAALLAPAVEGVSLTVEQAKRGSVL